MSNDVTGFTTIDTAAIGASKDASIAREKVQDLSERVKKIEDAILTTEGRLSVIETDLSNLKHSNSQILSEIKELKSYMDTQKGVWSGICVTAKASGWVIGLLYGIIGAILGYLLKLTL